MTDIQKLYDELQAQLKALGAVAQNPYPFLNNAAAQMHAPQQPIQEQTQQLSTSPVDESAVLSGQQELLLKMYDEFVTTDDGKALAANLNKFARFVQSKVAKSSDNK